MMTTGGYDSRDICRADAHVWLWAGGGNPPGDYRCICGARSWQGQATSDCASCADLRVELTRLQAERDELRAVAEGAIAERQQERECRVANQDSCRHLIEQNHTLQRQLEEAQIAVRSWRDAAQNAEAKARQVFETWRQSRPFQHGEHRSVLGEWFSHGTGQAFLDALKSAFQGSAEPPTQVESTLPPACGNRAVSHTPSPTKPLADGPPSPPPSVQSDPIPAREPQDFACACGHPLSWHKPLKNGGRAECSFGECQCRLFKSPPVSAPERPTRETPALSLPPGEPTLKAQIVAFVRQWCLDCGDRPESYEPPTDEGWNSPEKLEPRMLAFVESQLTELRAALAAADKSWRKMANKLRTIQQDTEAETLAKARAAVLQAWRSNAHPSYRRGFEEALAALDAIAPPQGEQTP